MLVSIVIPCYNSEKSIRTVVEMVMAEFDRWPSWTCEFVLVNDNSADGTFAEIRALGEQYPNVHGVSLMRNFGQHNALMCGLHYAAGDYVLGMDDDLQTHPSQLQKPLDKMQEGYDLVYGVYASHDNSAAKNLTSWLNKVTSRVLLGRPKEIQSSNYWIITRQVRDEVIRYTGFNPYIDGIFYRVTHKIGNVTIEHHKREFGKSGYTLKKLLGLWLAYFNFSVIPLRIASVVGILTAFAGFLMGIGTVIKKLMDPGLPVGWASLLAVQLFFFGVVLLVLGIIGEYLGKLVMTVNSAPQFVIRETVNIEDKR